MAQKAAIIHEGIRQIHATAAVGDYATLCGLDGADNYYSVQQSTDTVKPGERITCPHCRAIWQHVRTYRKSEFTQLAGTDNSDSPDAEKGEEGQN